MASTEEAQKVSTTNEVPNPLKKDEIRQKKKDRAIARMSSVIARLMNEWTPEKCQDLFTDKEILEVCYRARETFWSQPAMIAMNASEGVTVVGDIHGQFNDLRAILRKLGLPPASRYIFLGDLVDRGPYQLEVVTLLFALKALYPEHIALLRGNHESLAINYGYGFHNECESRYPSSDIYQQFNNCFFTMPFSALIEKTIFCIHGGISEELLSFEQLEKLERPCDIPDVGMLTDLTWADPDEDVTDYCENERGAGHLFGPPQLREFNNRMGVGLVVRAHQVKASGYELFDNGNLITIFSALHYIGQFDNDGAVLHVKRVGNQLKCSLTAFRISKRPREKSKTRQA
ncbi:calcineurin-like phosphoesterase domain-containing protein [Ditylenchus destructor]|uniref:Serine/threonine-protein phosphatase n=1 Tax=Ditylenchus destructor TaxID=166010 RepID=A0AAD4R5K4_9BILA|nr:calcineurin-like phosphoesterase domain-containing protein [Ditylenchus destructor]